MISIISQIYCWIKDENWSTKSDLVANFDFDVSSSIKDLFIKEQMSNLVVDFDFDISSSIKGLRITLQRATSNFVVNFDFDFINIFLHG